MKDGIIEDNEPETTTNIQQIITRDSGDSGEQAASIIGDLNAKPTFMTEGLKEADKQTPEVKTQTEVISPVEIGEDGCVLIIKTVYSVCKLALRAGDYTFDEATVQARGEVLYQCLQLYGIKTDLAKIVLPVVLIAGVGVDLLECRNYAQSLKEQQETQQKEEVKA